MVKKYTVCLFLLLIANINLSASQSHSEKNELLYGGIYMGTTIERAGTGHIEYRTYLRFYPNKKVILITSDLPIEDVRKSLLINGTFDATGTVHIKNDRISFTTNSGAGRVDYSGKIVGKKLELDGRAQIPSATFLGENVAWERSISS